MHGPVARARALPGIALPALGWRRIGWIDQAGRILLGWLALAVVLLAAGLARGPVP